MYERNYRAHVLTKQESGKQGKAKNNSPKGLSRKQWWLIGGAVLVVLLLVGIVFAIRAPQLQVVDISVTGAAVTDQSDVVDLVEGELQGSYLGFFPKRSVLLVHTAHLSRSIKSAFPRFMTVSVSRQGMQKVVVTVSEYKSTYLWCDSVEAEKCFFMDSQGTVFAEAPVFSGSAYPKLFGGTATAATPLPFIPFPASFLRTIDTVILGLRQENMQSLEFYNASFHSLKVVAMRGADTVTILFDPVTDLQQAFDALHTALRAPAFANMLRDGAKKLAYIDMRFEGKVVYKFQE